jgi:hypothetical protein
MTRGHHLRPILGAAVAAVAVLGCREAGTLPDNDPGPEQIPAGYDIAIVGGGAHSADLMEVLGLVVEVERASGGYEGPVTFSADPPPGIVVIFRPTTVLNSNSTDVLVVADGSVTPRLYQIEFRGRATNGAERVTLLELTVQAPP